MHFFHSENIPHSLAPGELAQSLLHQISIQPRLSLAPRSFHLIAHAQTHLLARQFIALASGRDPLASPVDHFIALDPAHPPAADDSVLWEQSWQDLFLPHNPVFAPENTFTTLLTRVTARSTPPVASFNARHIRLDYSRPPESTEPMAFVFSARERNSPRIACAAFARTPAQMIDPQFSNQQEPWRRLLLDALNAEPRQYPRHTRMGSRVTRESLQASPHDQCFDQLLAFRLLDDFENPVPAVRLRLKANPSAAPAIRRLGGPSDTGIQSFQISSAQIKAFLASSPGNHLELHTLTPPSTSIFPLRCPAPLILDQLPAPFSIEPETPLLIDLRLEKKALSPLFSVHSFPPPPHAPNPGPSDCNNAPAIGSNHPGPEKERAH